MPEPFSPRSTTSSVGPQRSSSRALEGLSYRPMEGGATMVLGLEPEWTKHDDYLASMLSKYAVLAAALTSTRVAARSRACCRQRTMCAICVSIRLKYDEPL